MGQAGAKQLSLVLRTEAQSHLRTLRLQKEVAEMAKLWQEDGAHPGLTLPAFKQLLAFKEEAAGLDERLFRIFDTDRNQKVDAFELLAACTLLAQGSPEEKLEALFPIFDFSGAGRLNFDEVNILLASVCRGVAKACGAPMADDQSILHTTRTSFDCHKLPYDKFITKEQLKAWIKHDIEAARFLQAVKGARSLSELEDDLVSREAAQAEAFRQLCPEGAAEASVDNLAGSAALRRALGAPAEDLFRSLLQAMRDSSGRNAVSAAGFASGARAWNVHRALDVAEEGSVPVADLPLLVWLCRVERTSAPAEVPEGAALDQLCGSLGLHPAPSIACLDWVAGWLRTQGSRGAK